MAKTFYAWTDILCSGNKLVKAGTVVTAADLGVTDSAWAGLIRTKVVRTTEYPPIPRLGNVISPVQYYRDKARRAEMMEDEDDQSSLSGAIPPDDTDTS